MLNPLKTSQRLNRRNHRLAVRQSKISTKYMLRRIKKEIKKNPHLGQKITVFSDYNGENLTHVKLGFDEVHLKQAGAFELRLFNTLKKCGYKVVEPLTWREDSYRGQYMGVLEGGRYC